MWYCTFLLRRVDDKGDGETEYPNSLNSRRRAKPSNLAFSTTKRMGEVKYLNSLTYPARELCISSLVC
ncbi:hypothetical protein BHM03_00033618 [Ensete ventricosum]|nr:hypothetical protein BHM03_00033618 [Ensete ventricosum]